MDKYYIVDYKNVDGIVGIFPEPKPQILYTAIEEPKSVRNPHGNDVF